MIPAIIIARGGSKRILRKNVKDFCGRPLVEWTIIEAQASHFLTDIYLSTDDDEIADIGMRNNIHIIRRPTMPDDTPGDVPIRMAIQTLWGLGHKFDVIVPLLPTAPLRLPDDIDNALSLYWRYAVPINSYVIGVCDIVAGFYGQKRREDIEAEYINYGDCIAILVQTGAINVEAPDRYIDKEITKQLRSPENRAYVAKIRKKEKKLYPKSIPYKMKFWQLYDIDTHEDFEYDEMIFQKYILDKGYYK